MDILVEDHINKFVWFHYNLHKKLQDQNLNVSILIAYVNVDYDLRIQTKN